MTNTNSKGIRTGATVVFTAEALECFSSARNTLFEIRDSRLTGPAGAREYVFSLAPIQEPEALNCTHCDISADDLEVYRG
jgi:hypothetical protein